MLLAREPEAVCSGRFARFCHVLKTIGRIVGAIIILVAFLIIGLLLAFRQTSLRDLFSFIYRPWVQKNR